MCLLQKHYPVFLDNVSILTKLILLLKHLWNLHETSGELKTSLWPYALPNLMIRCSFRLSILQLSQYFWMSSYLKSFSCLKEYRKVLKTCRIICGIFKGLIANWKLHCDHKLCQTWWSNAGLDFSRDSCTSISESTASWRAFHLPGNLERFWDPLKGSNISHQGVGFCG